MDFTTQGLGVDTRLMKALGLGQVLMNEKLDFLSNKEVLIVAYWISIHYKRMLTLFLNA